MTERSLERGSRCIAPAVSYEKDYFIESEMIHCFLGGTLLISKQGNLVKPGVKKSSMKKFTCYLNLYCEYTVELCLSYDDFVRFLLIKYEQKNQKVNFLTIQKGWTEFFRG